jgi:hypothetical protein
VFELEKKVAALEVAKRIDQEAAAQIQKSLSELQTQLGEQAQELAFYRGIASGGSASLRIVRVQVLPGPQAARYRVRVVLIRAARPQSSLTGTLSLTVDGLRGGHAASLPLADLGLKGELNFSLRSFTELEADITLPTDFRPIQVTIEARPKGAEAPLRHTIPWKVDTP